MSELSRPNCLVGRIDMSHDFSFTDLGQEIPTNAEVPPHLDVLPDGREVLVFGDPAEYA